MRVAKEWVRCREGNDHPYQYHDEERIFVGPYDPVASCPNPVELDPDDGSLGSWLDGVLHRETMAMLTNCPNDANKVAYAGSTIANAMLTVGASTEAVSNSLTSLKDQLNSIVYADSGGWDTGLIVTNTSEPKYELRSNGLYIDGTSFDEYIERTMNNISEKKEKENNTMNFNFDFGPVDSSVHMSMYGMAVKNANGNYVAYDANTKSIMDVDILNFEGANKFIYKMPVALGDVAVGDVVIHMRKPMIVTAKQDKSFTVVDVYNGEEKTIIPARSPFGWDFMTKVVSLFNFNGTADASNPFGNMLPLLLLSDSKSKDDNLLPLMLMAGGNMDMSNPMMLWALMGNRTNDPIMLAMAMGGFKQPTHSCACGDKCSCHKAE